MGLHSTIPSHITPDVIIAGGGTAGCIVAARLAEADPSLTILVIEGGPDNRLPTVEAPALFIQNLDPSTKTNVFYDGNASEHVAGRAPVVPTGGVLGGGSSTNLMMYSRGMRPDYEWGPGWMPEDVLPYFKKLETYHGADPTDRHGTSGPIHVSDGPFRGTHSEQSFIEAAAKTGWPEVDDLQILDVNDAVQRAKKFVSPDGKRQDTASRYLRPLLEDGNHPNLHVLVEHQVLRVVFSGTKATGIEYRPNPAFRPSEPSTSTITASRMIILSCGALSTPLLLERSGIGSPSILSQSSIPVISPLPGVGTSYQDHNLVIYPYHSSLSPSDTLDPLASGRLNLTDLLATNSPILGWNAQDVACKLRPPTSALSSLGSDFLTLWNRDFAPHTSKPLMLASLVGAFPADQALLKDLPPVQYFSISTFTAYPYSRGSIHISPSSSSSSDSLTCVDFTPGFFSHPFDLAAHKWMYKTQRTIARRMSVFRGEFAPLHPPFPATSQAFCPPEKRTEPLPEEKVEIEYTEEDERILEQWLRENVGTTWHSLGTCAMKKREEGGVVDWGLGVYGVEGLKVADLSVMPKNVGANTAATAMMVGEKAADLFLGELGLRA